MSLFNFFSLEMVLRHPAPEKQRRWQGDNSCSRSANIFLSDFGLRRPAVRHTHSKGKKTVGRLQLSLLRWTNTGLLQIDNATKQKKKHITEQDKQG